MKFNSFVFSHPGKVRSNNEDNLVFMGKLFSDENLSNGVYVEKTFFDKFDGCICDGMGGESYGEIASKKSVETFLEYYPINCREKLDQFVEKANHRICKLMKEHSARIGTTYVGVSVDGSKAQISNIGDSKLFLFRNGKAKQLSVDHTIYRTMIDSGVFSEEQLKASGIRNSLSQHIGIFPDELILEPYFNELSLYNDDSILLCSDGLTDMVSIDKITELIYTEKELKKIANGLFKYAMHNGGKDNITVIYVHVKEN